MNFPLFMFSNIVGAIVANLINVLVIAVLIARLSNRPKIEYWLGIILTLSIVPLAYLFIKLRNALIA